MTVSSWPRYDVLGIRVDSVSAEQAAGVICDMAARRMPGYVCVTGTHGIVEAQSDEQLVEIHNASTLTVPDGKPVARCGRMVGLDTEQVRGVELSRAVLAEAERTGTPVAFAGSTDEVLDSLRVALRRDYPELRVAFCRALPFGGMDDDYLADLRRDVAVSGATICFLGLSTPKQERMAAQLKDVHWPFVTLAVGAAFDFLAGTKAEAPTWTRRIYLEWAYRMVSEPKRLSGRYRRVVPRFLAEVSVRKPQRLPDVVNLWQADATHPLVELPDPAAAPAEKSPLRVS
jgi:N-acetylglucosaminyldiphosphoundecaprenol N-acetyl-beta-D-mannosaminyltransferase